MTGAAHATRAFGLIGHADVIEDLRAYRGHALLLVGPERVGKRPLARVLAALVNCPRPGGPCGACASCVAVLQGVHPDVLEIEPRAVTSTGKTARRRVIPVSFITRRRDPDRDHENHVVEWLDVGPTYRRRVVVVDGAEHLNEESANALLKVVEEPPHGALFVFVAQEAAAVLPTIVSRAARVNVPPVPDAELAGVLRTLGDEDPDLLAFAAGRPGVIVERDRARAALADARALVDGLGDSMLAALEAAEGLEKRFDPLWHPEALRFVLSAAPLDARAAADDAIERAVEALEQYVSASLAFQLLALELRAALGHA